MKRTGLGNMIRERREELGISQAELAKHVGISQPSLHNIENGQTKKSRYLTEIYSKLGLDPLTGRKTGIRNGDIHLLPGSHHTEQQASCPVYQMRPSQTGGMMLSAEPARYVVKPALLATVTEAFGIAVSGNENHPAYKGGDIVFIDPHQEPIIGSDVVVRPVDKERLDVDLGELIEESARAWKVRPYNGEERTYSKSEWTCAHIVGKYNRR